MRALPAILLLLATGLLAWAAPPAAALEPVPGACAREGTVLTCDVQIHEVGPNGPYHVLPERIDAKVGDTLKLHVTNQGNSTHNLVVCGDGTAPSDKCSDIWAFTQDMPAKAEKDITVQSVPKGGTFYYFCMKPGHAAIGMKGDLVVAGQAAKKSGGEATLGGILALAGVALVARRR